MHSNILGRPQADYFQRVQTSKYLISLKYPKKAKILFTFRSHDSILPHKWDDLDHFLRQHNMEILPSEPNGHCFLNTSLFSATTTSSSEDLHMQSQDDDLYVQSQDEDLPDSFEIESLLTNISCGKPFPTWFFEGISPKLVSTLPEDINGTCFYKIKVKGDDWHRAT